MRRRHEPDDERLARDPVAVELAALHGLDLVAVDLPGMLPIARLRAALDDGRLYGPAGCIAVRGRVCGHTWQVVILTSGRLCRGWKRCPVCKAAGSVPVGRVR